jgi:hypothetical protein
VEDFEAVFRAISKQGEDLIILVGGHAVNVWGLAYKERIEQQLRAYWPLTSGDMDVYATRNALMALHQELGGKLLLSGPREITDGTLVLGVEPDTRELDVLRSVNGIPKIEAQDSMPMKVCGYDVPVLFPHLLLQGKLENALHLNQAERQDVKHVKVLALVLHEFLKEVVGTATPENERPALALLQKTLAVLISENAQQFSRLHGTAFGEIMPLELLEASPLKRLAKFGREQVPRAFGVQVGKGAFPSSVSNDSPPLMARLLKTKGAKKSR